MSSAHHTLLGWAFASMASAAGAAPPDVHLQLCTACHGPNGNSVIAENPRLAGLDPNYLLRQLVDFKSGKRKSAVMSQIVNTLDHDSLREIVEYFGEQKPAPGQVSDEALVPQGKAIFEKGVAATSVPDCGSCHGSDGAGDAKYPRLAGQHAPYVERQLLAFKSGERSNDSKGVMGAVAKRLSDPEIRAVAQFVAGLKLE